MDSPTLIDDLCFCASSFLQYRRVISAKRFPHCDKPKSYTDIKSKFQIYNSDDLNKALKQSVENACADGNAALALSAGIDSGILAKYMPANSLAITFKCRCKNPVDDQTVGAQKFATACGLQHRIVDVTWQDMVTLSPLLMRHKNAPIHSIEVQIYKGALEAKKYGIKRLIFGESADANYGGLDKLLSREWTVGDFIERISFVLPYKVLKNFQIITDPVLKHEKLGYINVHEYLRNEFYMESMSAYENACQLADVEFIAPFAETRLAIDLDLSRIRNGEGKYLVRSLFRDLYAEFEIPPKVPMPRPMTEWLQDYRPHRSEIYQNCTDSMSGDQKWLIYSLELFLDMIFPEKR